MSARHVVIVGGGFAGVEVAKRLERMLPPTHRITLVSQENYLTFNPLLAEAVGASILPSHVVAPIRQMLKRTRFRMATITDIDLERRVIQYLGEGSGSIDYDELILACGVAANLDLVPGMALHALPLKTMGDAMFLRNRVMARLEHADQQPDATMRRWLATFVIVGGGFSGVEVAGEIDDLLDSAVRYYPHLADMERRVILLHSGDHLLPELPRKLGEFAARKMRKTDIDVRLGARVARVDAEGLTLASGERVSAGTVICTIGTQPHPLVAGLPLPKLRGRIQVEPDMSVPDFPGVWAVGDCAAVPNAYDGAISPPTAQFAVAQARALAANLARRVRGDTATAFRYKPKGALASIGHNKAVAEVFGVRVYGFVGWLLWRGVYLLKIPTLARKVRIFLEWNWEMLFPPDIVHLRYSRSRRGRAAPQRVIPPVAPVAGRRIAAP